MQRIVLLRKTNQFLIKELIKAYKIIGRMEDKIRRLQQEKVLIRKPKTITSTFTSLN